MMAEVKWIKIATDIFDNQKIKIIESMPEGDAIIVIWFKILMLAGNVNDGGSVYFTKDIPYTD
jgi:predicted phage replisome organizer